MTHMWISLGAWKPGKGFMSVKNILNSENNKIPKIVQFPQLDYLQISYSYYEKGPLMGP